LKNETIHIQRCIATVLKLSDQDANRLSVQLLTLTISPIHENYYELSRSFCLDALIMPLVSWSFSDFVLL